MALSKIQGIEGQVTPNFGRRNILYNGAMQVAQRGTSFSGGTSNALYTLDRWATAVGSSFNLDTTITQSTTVPSGEGFKYSLKVEADAVVSTTSGQNGGITQRLEAQDVSRLGYGTSSAKSLTLSFWVRSNKTGTYCAQLQTNIGNSDGSNRYSHVKEYTISSANTWEKKILTFPGHTGQVIDSSANNDGLRINWWLASDAADNQTANTWNQVAAYGSTSNQVDFMDSASNEWYLTGCQLEVGDTATEFEHRPFGEEFSLCKRYYEKSYPHGVAAGTANGGIGAFHTHAGRSRGNNYGLITQRYTVEKRAAATVTMYSYGGTSGAVSHGDTGSDMGASTVIQNGTTSFLPKNASGGTFADNALIYHYAADSEL